MARGGAQLVLKTRPSIASRGFNSFTFRQLIADFRLPIANWSKVQVLRLTESSSPIKTNRQSAICNRKSTGPVAQGNESATLRRSRPHVQIVPGPPSHFGFGISDLGFSDSGRTHTSQTISLTHKIRNPKSQIRNRFAGVAQQAGGASLRN